MIDLGDELADYDSEKPPRDPESDMSLAEFVEFLQNTPIHFGTPQRIPLADLQAQGFNTEPPPGYEPIRKMDERG